VVSLQGSGEAFAALRKDGTVDTWGYNGLRYSSRFLMMIVNRNSIVGSGGDSSAVRDELKGVVAIAPLLRHLQRRGATAQWLPGALRQAGAIKGKGKTK